MIAWPLSEIICGEPYSVHMSSGAVYQGNRPDESKIKEGGT